MSETYLETIRHLAKGVKTRDDAWRIATNYRDIAYGSSKDHRRILAESRHPNAAVEEFGETVATLDGKIDWFSLAWAALYADIWAEVEK